jgi:hypothetical protein
VEKELAFGHGNGAALLLIVSITRAYGVKRFYRQQGKLDIAGLRLVGRLMLQWRPAQPLQPASWLFTLRRYSSATRQLPKWLAICSSLLPPVQRDRIELRDMAASAFASSRSRSAGTAEVDDSHFDRFGRTPCCAPSGLDHAACFRSTRSCVAPAMPGRGRCFAG